MAKSTPAYRISIKYIPDSEREVCLRFASARRFEKISQEELANKLAISRDQIANIESCRVELKFGIGFAFCSLFNVSQLWLASGELPKSPFMGLERTVHHLEEFEDLLFSEVCLGHLAPILRTRQRLTSAINDRDSASDLLAETYQEAFDRLLKLVLLEVPAADRIEFIGVLASTVRAFKAARAGHGEAKRQENNSQEGLDMSCDIREKEGVQTRIDSLGELMKRVRERTAVRGARAALARELNVSRQAVDQWLSGDTSPAAEITVRLMNWVYPSNRKLNTLGSTNTAKGKTQVRKSPNEKQTQVRKKS